jgi:hypothetical protein
MLVPLSNFSTLISESPEKLEKKTHTYRGFLHKTSDGKLFLAPQPQLKSCCQGSKARSHEQIFLEGSFEPLTPNKVIEISGKLESREESGIKRYFLTDSNINVKKRRRLSIYPLMIGAFGGLGFFFYQGIKRRKESFKLR